MLFFLLKMLLFLLKLSLFLLIMQKMHILKKFKKSCRLPKENSPLDYTSLGKHTQRRTINITMSIVLLIMLILLLTLLIVLLIMQKMHILKIS